MESRLRFLALMALGLAVATVAAMVVTWAQRQPVAGVPLAIQETTTTPPPAETTPTTLDGPTTTPSRPTRTTKPSAAPLTIANRKTVTNPPPCASLVTKAQIADLTGATPAQEPEDKGYCGFNLATGGSPAGVAMVVLTPSTDVQGGEATTFEGNTAYRTSTAANTCDLRIALTDDPAANFRALWVTLVIVNATEPICPKVDRLAKLVFDKLPTS
jgi:hypothetical protein